MTSMDIKTERALAKFLENTFLKVMENLEEKEYKPIEINKELEASEEFINFYDYYVSDAVSGVSNGVIFFKYWKNAVNNIAFITSTLMELNSAAEDIDIAEDFIQFINSQVDLLIQTFKDLLAYKLYLMALEKKYSLKHSKPLIFKVIQLETELAKGFKHYNDLVEIANQTIISQCPGMELLACVKYNDAISGDILNRIIEPVEDKDFISRPYYYVNAIISEMINVGLVYPPYLFYI